MNGSLLRRFAAFFLILALLLTAFAGVNLWRFSPDKWLLTQVSEDIGQQLRGNVSSGRFGTALSWSKPEVQWQDYLFSANELRIEFNLMSVIIGKPSLKQVTIESPFLEVPIAELNIQQLRLLANMGFQQLTIHDGYFLTGQNEVQSIELSMTKNGVFGEYAVQLSGEIVAPQWSANVNYATLFGIDGDNQLVMGKTQVDANLVVDNWIGHLSGKVKTLILSETNNADIKYLNWSSAWQDSDNDIEHAIDWAGGLTNALYQDGTWTLSTVDTAIAYIDERNAAHTLALQSNNTSVVDGDLDGQLALSLLTEYPAGSEWQSYNLVMSGTMLPGNSIFNWTAPDIRLSFYDADNLLHNHFIKVRELNLDEPNQSLQLLDGDWQWVRNELPNGDFGFGELTGSWPSLQFTSAPTVAAPYLEVFSVIAPDIEYLDALFNQLVP